MAKEINSDDPQDGKPHAGFLRAGLGPDFPVWVRVGGQSVVPSPIFTCRLSHSQSPGTRDLQPVAHRVDQTPDHGFGHFRSGTAVGSRVGRRWLAAQGHAQGYDAGHCGHAGPGLLGLHHLCQPSPQGERRRVDVVFVFTETGVLRDEGRMDFLFRKDIAEGQAIGLQESVLHKRKALGTETRRGVR